MRPYVEVTPRKAILPRIRANVAVGHHPTHFSARRHLGSWYAVLGLTGNRRQVILMDVQPYQTRLAALGYAHELMLDATQQYRRNR